MVRPSRHIGKPSIRYRLPSMPRLRRISIAPVKSLALQHPQEVVLEATGVTGDRLFYLADPSGRLVTGSAFGPLVQVASRYDPATQRLALLFPDGSSVEDEALASGQTVQTDFYGRPVSAHTVDGPFAEALSGYAGRPVRLARVDRAGDGTDIHHLTIVSAESVAELGRRAGREPDPDARRFRMLLEIEGCTEPHEEDAWDGRRVRVGEAIVRMMGPVPRCVVTTQDPATGRRDLDTLKTIKGYRGVFVDEDGPGLPFGMYAEVETPGAARVGDEVAPV